jgi:Na+/H+ antiporter NhaD/arsenite permease-like protein
VLTVICIIFFFGYLCIAFEHPIRINKAASALATGVLCWTLYAINSGSMVAPESIPTWFADKLASQGDGHLDHAKLSLEFMADGQLHTLLAEISGILFFLLGAMTIVELVDAYEGFALVTKRITATNKVKLLWIVGVVTFFMSSVLDNLTTTIVMISLLRKLIKERETRLLFVGIVVIAANAGGAWTVIGDVTTTMLWIKNKISTFEVMVRLILPSIVCLVVPLVILSMFLRGNVHRPEADEYQMEKAITPNQQKLMLFIGLIGLISVPIFKTITHLPPLMGMMGSLSVLWIVSELVHRRIDHEYTRSTTHVLEVLKRVDSSAILFFLGILLAVGCLSSTGLLTSAANALDSYVGNYSIVALLIGLISAVVDNVPLVAAGIEMYKFQVDHPFWHMLAFCAGTGGSCLIIGSAAGVAAMGLERIDFMWYLRYIAPLALAGYLCGAATLGLLDAYVFNNGSAKSDKAFINGEVSLCLPFEGSILSLNSCRR